MREALLILAMLFFSSMDAFSATWTYQIRQVTKDDRSVIVVVTIYDPVGKEYGGREIAFLYDDIKTKTKTELLALFDAQVIYAVQQLLPEYSLKQSVESAPLRTVSVP